MSEWLQTKLSDIDEGEVFDLIRELEQACPVSSQQFTNTPLLLFLTQCVYPNGAGKRAPITTHTVVSAPLLESRVGRLPDGPLRNLCGELAQLSQSTLEFFGSNKVYMLLNKTLPKFAVKRPGETQRRWEAVVNQRRSSRD